MQHAEKQCRRAVCRWVRSDCIVLAGIILFSTLPYLFGLGFYSDDWMYQGWFAQAPDHGIGRLLWTLFTHDPDLRVRPVQAIYLAMSFKAFGRQPTGYHVAASLILAALPVLMYLVLRELRVGRWLTFTIPLVFGMLPHYSTDRFWNSSQQATLSMIFAMLGIYGMLRWRRGDTTSSKGWLFASILAFALSILSYEVALGLIVASLGVMGFYGRRAPAARSSRSKWWRWLALTSLVLMVVGMLKIALQTRIHPQYRFLGHLGGRSWHAIVEAVRFNFWTYGLRLPAVVVSLYRHGALSWVALVVASILGIFVSAYLWTRLGSCQLLSRRACLWLMVAGFIIFGLGYGLFFPNAGVDFSSPGINNRITIASALGASCVVVGIVGLGCSLVKSDPARVRACAVAIGLICGAYCLVLSGIGFFWRDASLQQGKVSGLIAGNLRSLPKGSVVLLDGLCRYSGPGIVFETDWDTTGALQLALGDGSLKADVVSPDLHFGDTVVDPVGKAADYGYGPHLFVYDLRRNTLTSLASKDAALAYLSMANPTQHSGCPRGRNGEGVRIF